MGCCSGNSRSVLPHGGEILLLGCEGAGKTLLCRHLQRMTSRKPPAAALDTNTQPSIGVELLDVAHARRVFSLREVGGAMQPVWPRYFDNCRMVVFVADTSSARAAGDAVVEWHGPLAAEALREKPALLLLNQRDRADALPEATVGALFRIPELQAAHPSRDIDAMDVSALTGLGLQEMLAWIAKRLPES